MNPVRVGGIPIRNPLSNLVLTSALVLVPLLGSSSRLFHPAPWIALVAGWLIFATQPQLGAEQLVKDRTDRLSALAISMALVGSVVLSVVDFGYMESISPAALSAATLGGVSLAAGGLALRLWAIRTLGQFFTSTVQVVPGQPVVEHGPYQLLRHPSYSGALLTVLGIATAFGSAEGAVATLILGVPAYAYRIAVEERVMTAQLGEAYRAYRARTWRLLPFAY